MLKTVFDLSPVRQPNDLLVLSEADALLVGRLFARLEID